MFAQVRQKQQQQQEQRSERAMEMANKDLRGALFIINCGTTAVCFAQDIR